MIYLLTPLRKAENGRRATAKTILFNPQFNCFNLL